MQYNAVQIAEKNPVVSVLMSKKRRGSIKRQLNSL